MLRHLPLVLFALVLCAPTALAQADALVGTWELVAQEGYPESHPKDVEQRLTFEADGALTMVQGGTIDGEHMEQEQAMRYRTEGDALVLVVEGYEMPMAYRIEDGRLTIESEAGQRDIYVRAE